VPLLFTLYVRAFRVALKNYPVWCKHSLSLILPLVNGVAWLLSRSFSVCKVCTCVSYFRIVASRRASNEATLRSDSERSSLWRLKKVNR